MDTTFNIKEKVENYQEAEYARDDTFYEEIVTPLEDSMFAHLYEELGDTVRDAFNFGRQNTRGLCEPSIYQSINGGITGCHIEDASMNSINYLIGG